MNEEDNAFCSCFKLGFKTLSKMVYKHNILIALGFKFLFSLVLGMVSHHLQLLKSMPGESTMALHGFHWR